MKSSLFNNSEVSILFALRSRYVDCKANFKSKYRNTNLLCEYCSESDDTQQHILQCKVINSILRSTEIVQEKVEYNDIFKDIKKQKAIVSIFSKLLEIRKNLKNQENLANPSILDKMLKKSYNLQTCIVNFSFGK